MQIVGLRKEVAIAQTVVHHAKIIRRRAQEVVIQDFHPLVLHRRGRSPPDKGLDRDGLDARALVANGHGVVEGQGLAQPLLAGEPETDAGLPFENKQGAGAKVAGGVGHLLVEARKDRGHQDHAGRADQHAQDGEEGAELVRPEGIQSEQQVFTHVPVITDHFSSPSAELRSDRAGRPSTRDKFRKTVPPRSKA